MNCSRCGAQLPKGAAACPRCGAACYPTGYQQPYAQNAAQHENSLYAILSDLPRAFLDSFVRPGEVLRRMVERRDLLSGPVVAVLVLVLSFLNGMVLMRGMVGELFRLVSALTGVSMAGSAASMNQGVSYIAGRVAPGAGGIAALCQLISIAVPAVVFLFYICVVCKVTFSAELMLGHIAVVSLPTVGFSLLSMAASLLTPWLGLIIAACGCAVSYVQAVSILAPVTAQPEAQLTGAKIACSVLSLAITLMLGALMCFLLGGGVWQRIQVLMSSVGSLI